MVALIITAATFGFASPTYAVIRLGSSNTVSLSNGLVGYWTFDGPVTNWNTNTTLDLSGNGNSGQLIGMSTSTSPTPGKIGQALKFNYSSNNITVSNVSQVSNGAPLTILGWFKTSSTLQGMLIDQVYVGSNDIGIQYEVDGTLAYYQNDNAYTFCETTASFSDGRWHFLTAVQPNTNLRQLYVDGVLQCSDPNALDGISGSPALNIGAFFQGALDDVRIYNRALTAGEVQQLYKLGTDSAAHSNTVALSNGLVGYWTFDGSATNWTTGQTRDLSGQGNTGTLVNMSTTTSPTLGNIGQALMFDGSTNYVEAGNTSPLSITAGTVSAWVKGSNDPTSSGVIVSKEDYDSDHNGYTLAVSGGAILGEVAQANSSDSMGVTNGCPHYLDNTWTFLTFTFDGSKLRGYMNGALVCSVAQTVTPVSNVTNLRIGDSPTGVGYKFKGSIDDARIYNRALTQGEIQQLYNLGTANAAHSNVGISSGLVGYWTFDGPTVHWRSNTVDDQSGQGNTGTLVNMSTTSSPTPGKIGQAMKFNGTSGSYVTSASPFMSGNMVTYGGWVYFDTLTCTGFYCYVMQQTNASDQGFELFADTSGGNHIYCWDGTAATSPVDISPGTWYHVMCRHDGTKMQLYLNGNLRAMQSSSQSVTATNFVVGGGDDQNNYWMKGKVDDVRIYNRALSDREIKQLYTAGR